VTAPSFDLFLSELQSCSRASSWNLVVVRRTDSSNRLARRMARELTVEGLPVPAAAVVAYEQTAGRGRLGRRWASPPGGGVYASLLLPAPPPEKLAALPLVVPLALCVALDRQLEHPCRLKWPNDLLVEGRKIGGVLVETNLRAEGGEAIVGFGINYQVPAEGFEEGMTTGVSAEARFAPGLGALAWELLWEVGSALDQLQEPAAAAQQYLEKSIHRLGDRMRCRLAERSVEGRLLGLTGQGFLRLQVDEGEEVISAGEVVEP
jgi:BirA family transcriptional regulator, biotin operon repressor / biotin---[acetyl-CoA-carboxylase] ligase